MNDFILPGAYVVQIHCAHCSRRDLGNEVSLMNEPVYSICDSCLDRLRKANVEARKAGRAL